MKLEKDAQGDSEARLQENINLLHSTAESWGLTMNLQKCVVLHFRRRFHDDANASYTLNDSAISSVASCNDLGVVIDTELKFHEHCAKIAGKAGGVAHNFLKSTRCRLPDFMVHVWTVHIRPILEYASPLWNSGYSQDLKRLESIQRLWTRNILGLRDQEYGDRLRALDLFSVKGSLLRADRHH